MEKKVKNLTVLIVALVFALCICFVRINQLSSDISRLENAINRQHKELMNQVESIYSNVDEMLKEEASLLAAAEAEYGKLNPDAHTIDVSLKIVPKLISEDMKAYVSIHGRQAELIRNGNAFTGEIPVNLFNEDEQLMLNLETDAGIQTQYISDISVGYLWGNYLPSLYYCDISGHGSFSEGKYTLNGSVDINLSPFADTPDVWFEKFVLVTELNGKQINSEDMTEAVLNYELYPHGTYFRDEYHMECEASEGDELIIRLEATDSMGYVHKILMHHWKTQNGATAETVNGGERIYDADGKLVFGKE